MYSDGSYENPLTPVLVLSQDRVQKLLLLQIRAKKAIYVMPKSPYSVNTPYQTKRVASHFNLCDCYESN